MNNYGGYDTSSYDTSNNAFNGGGFVANSQMNNNNNNNYSQAGGVGGIAASQGGAGGSGGKKRDPQSLLPVTIKQLHEAETRDQSKFKIDSKDVAQVTFIGLILSIDVKTTNITYSINDGSGDMQVKLYIDEGDDSAARREDIKEVTYVRVFGHLRTLNETRHVVAFQLLPVIDFNEITYHALDVIATHCKHTKGQAHGGPGSAVKSESHGSVASANAHHVSDPIAHSANGSFTPLQNSVLAIFSSGTNTDSGTSIQEVCAKLSNYQFSDIRSAVEYLSDEGHLYSTIDEDHYKCTSAN